VVYDTAPHRGPEAAISAWTPKSYSQAVASFTRQVVVVAEPASPARARALLYAVGKLASFAERCGLPLDTNTVFHPSVMERFLVLSYTTLSPGTRRTVATNLRSVSTQLIRPATPEALKLPRERAKVPYSTSQIASYLQLADAQPTETRRHHGGALICLGAGAGLMGTDLRTVRGSDVVLRSGGVISVTRKDGREQEVEVQGLSRVFERDGVAYQFAYPVKKQERTVVEPEGLSL